MFVMGFGFGFLGMTRVLAILILGILGGLSIGIRVILLGNGLLISDPDAFFANWLIIGVCGIVGSILVVWKQRYGVVCCLTQSYPMSLLIVLFCSSVDVLQLVRFYAPSGSTLSSTNNPV